MTQNGYALYEKLSQLQYPDIHKFSPTSIDWLFDNDEAVPFLQWFCESVQPINLLTGSQLKRFDKLKAKGVTILEGKRLEEALANHCDDKIDPVEIENEIQELKTQRDVLLGKKHNYIKQLNSLSQRDKQIGKRILELDVAIGNSQTREEKLAEKLLCQMAALDIAKTSLQTTAEKLVSFLDTKQTLCHLSFDEFFDSEEDYTLKLTDFANHQFEQDMGVMAQNSGSEMCAFIRVGECLGRSIGPDGQHRKFQNWELDHYQKLLPSAEGERIANETEIAALTAASDSYKQILSRFSADQYPSTISTVSLAKEELAAQNTNALKKIVSLKKNVMELVKKSVEVRCSSVVIGDCSLKLLRQEFFISKQKEFLALMTRQWAREQLVSFALRHEGQQLERVLCTLKDIVNEIEKGHANFVKRSNALEATFQSEKSTAERNTIPSCDLVSRSLLSVLNCTSDVAVSNCVHLVESASEFQRELKSTVATCQKIREDQLRERKNLERIVTSMEQLVFGGPISSTTQSLQRCDTLEKKLSELELLRQDVQSRFKPHYRDFKSKHSSMKNDHLKIFERRLWTLFYTDASSMLRKTEALNAKAAAF